MKQLKIVGLIKESNELDAICVRIDSEIDYGDFKRRVVFEIDTNETDFVVDMVGLNIRMRRYAFQEDVEFNSRIIFRSISRSVF